MTACAGEYPLELLLRVSGMSRSTYSPRGVAAPQEEGRREDALIAEVFSGSGRGRLPEGGGGPGAPRGGLMNFKTVNRRMRSMGLVCTYRRKRRRQGGGGAGHAPTCWTGKFRADAPLEKLVTDVTEMRVLGGGRLYLSSIMDAQQHGLARACPGATRGRWSGRCSSAWSGGGGVPRGVMIHSDQGGLYRCREYLRFAREHGVVRSMSGRGSCYDNAVIESHFGNLKGRLGRLDRVPADKAAEMIDEAVRYFNEERILLKLGGLSSRPPGADSLKHRKLPRRGQSPPKEVS